MNTSLSPFAPENLVLREGFGSSVPRQPAHFHTQAESGAHLRDSSRVPRRRPSIYFYLFKPPYAIGSVPSLPGHANAYRWCSLPRVRRHRASKPQGSSERGLPWQITMDQLKYTPLFSHTQNCFRTRQLMVEFYLLTFSRFPPRPPEYKSCFEKNRTHDFRTSRCARLPTRRHGRRGCTASWWVSLRHDTVDPIVTTIGKSD